MPQQAFCPEHGPYDASLGACPYPHAGASPRPSAPRSLEDDLPTDFGSSDISTGMPTMPHAVESSDDEETEIPRSIREGDDLTELDVSTPPVMGLLWVKEGPRRGKYYPIKHGTIIGRKEGSLILDDPKVSSRHAKFTVENDDFVIWDLGTSNGTMVNGRKIREATTLQENDLIKIGESVFVIKLLESKPKKKTPASKIPTGLKARKPRKSAK